MSNIKFKLINDFNDLIDFQNKNMITYSIL